MLEDHILPVKVLFYFIYVGKGCTPNTSTQICQGKARYKAYIVVSQLNLKGNNNVNDDIDCNQNNYNA